MAHEHIVEKVKDIATAANNAATAIKQESLGKKDGFDVISKKNHSLRIRSSALLSQLQGNGEDLDLPEIKTQTTELGKCIQGTEDLLVKHNSLSAKIGAELNNVKTSIKALLGSLSHVQILTPPSSPKSETFDTSKKKRKDRSPSSSPRESRTVTTDGMQSPPPSPTASAPAPVSAPNKKANIS